MAIPHDDTIQREILELLDGAPDGRMHLREVYDRLARLHPELTADERYLKYQHSLSEWANRVQFARLHLVGRGFVFRAGAGPNPQRGFWIITDSGREYVASVALQCH